MADIFDFRDHVRTSPEQARRRRWRRALLGPKLHDWLRRRPDLGLLPSWAGLRVALLAGVAGGLIFALFPSTPSPYDPPADKVVAAKPTQFDIRNADRPWDEGLTENGGSITPDLLAEEGFVAPARGGTAAPTISPADVEIIDGDTFRYRGVKVRIAGIDTPETFSPRCPEEAALGVRATNRMGELLAAGPFELGSIDRDTDVYGRKLRNVSRNGKDLGEVLIAEGLARPYGEGRRSWCA